MGQFHIVHRATNKIHSSHPSNTAAYTELIGSPIDGRYYHADYSVYSDEELRTKIKRDAKTKGNKA